MAETKDLGRLFVQRLALKRNTPPVHRAPSVEIQPPYRKARPWVFHIPFTGLGIAIGWWQDSGWDEETALYEAVSGWGLNPYDLLSGDPEVKQTIRENVAASGLDAEDEWKIIQMLGAEQ